MKCTTCGEIDCKVHTNPDVGKVRVLDVVDKVFTPENQKGTKFYLNTELHNEIHFFNRGNTSINIGCDCLGPGDSLGFGSKNDINLYRIKKLKIEFLDDDPLCIIENGSCEKVQKLVMWTADDCSRQMEDIKKNIK